MASCSATASEIVISPSLLANLDPSKKVPDRYKLGMSEWTDSDSEKENDADFQPCTTEEEPETFGEALWPNGVCPEKEAAL